MPPIIEEILENMVLVTGGIFSMGNNAYAPLHGWVVHDVQLDDFKISKTTVTQKQYQLLMGDNPSVHVGDLNRPVEYVSWYDSIFFIEHLNALSKMNFRLPTEAEWEYAARGGNLHEPFIFSGSNILSDVGWAECNSGYQTHPVGTINPNGLGLYDMSGNVSEWCQDWYGEYSQDNIPVNNPMGPVEGTEKIRRGGHFGSTCRIHSNATVFSRSKRPPQNRYDMTGFRIVLGK
jgi:formylglycine-generating enzyme required for sulfatase activity